MGELNIAGNEVSNQEGASFGPNPLPAFRYVPISESPAKQGGIDNMKKIINILILAVILAALMSSLFLTGNTATDQSTPVFYERCINKQIRMFLLKADLYKNSRFEHIRKSAALAMKKAAFLRINMNRLIGEMIEQQVGKKHYHIQAYLEKKFQENSPKETHVAYRSANSNE